MGYERNDRGGYGDNRGGYDRDQGRGYGSQGNYGNRDARSERFGDRDRGYDRSSGYGADRNYGSDRSYGSDRGGFGGDRHGSDRDRGYGRDYGRAPQGYDYQDRGFFDRAGDEVRSWFGDEEAERRRRMDERYAEQQGGNDRRYEQGGRYAPYGSGYTGPSGGSFASGDRGGGYSPGDYGAGQGAGATSQWGLGAGRDQNEWGRDPGYHSWRDRQIQALDNDYDEYRREHQSKFDTEFGLWRTNRQGQRDMASKVQEHAEVVGSDGKHVGTVDHVRGDNLLLTKTDQDAGGRHHLVPSSWIQSAEGNKVTLSKTADQAKAQWRDAEAQQNQNSGIFSRDNRETRDADRTKTSETASSAGTTGYTRS